MRTSKRHRSRLHTVTDSAVVGPLATPGCFTVPLGLNVREAISRVRTSGKRGDIFYIYVTDDAGKLAGIVSIRNLLLAQDEDSIASIYSRSVVFLPESTPIERAYHIFSESKFLSLPVVDKDGGIKGVLHAHTLIEEYGNQIDTLFEERTRGELFELLGIKAESSTEKFFSVAWGRLPWLVVNILGGTVSAFFIHTVGGRLPNAVMLLAFVPILLIVSESIGMQTASLVIASLHRTGHRKMHGIWLKELLIALVLGLCCAALVGGGAYLWQRSGEIAWPVTLTVFLGAVLVSTLGNAIPRLFHRLKIDPRVAAGPVVLAIADCSTLIVYLLICLGFAIGIRS